MATQVTSDSNIGLSYLLKNLGQSVPLASLRLVSTSECNCLDWTLTYECTIMGGPGGATVWTGTALNCPSDEIVLLHSRFTDPGGTTRRCNNGATAAQSLYVQNNLYTSQLNTTITNNVAGKTIMCIYDGMGDGTVGNMNLSWFSIQIPETFGRQLFNTNTVCITSTSSLATALIVCIAVSSIVIATILKRSNAKIKAALELPQLQLTNRSTHTESMYEDITGPHSSTAINTTDNVAYGHTKKSTTTSK